MITYQDIENTIKAEDMLDIKEKIEALQDHTEPQILLREDLLALGLNDLGWL